MAEPIKPLQELIARLRGPQGCPWDRRQTAQSLCAYLVEEAFEAVDAIQSGDPAAVAEELGDLLFQLVFIVELFAEQGDFDLDRVVAICREKMIRRHPHVFGEAKAETAEQVKASWQRIKQAERQPGASRLDGLPRGLPALMRGHRLSDRAAQAGLDWPDAGAVLAKVEEELGELKLDLARGGQEAAAGELGDALFAMVNLGRHLKVRAEDALARANAKFERRFRRLEEICLARRLDPALLEPAALDMIWNEVKSEENKADNGG